YPKTRGGKQPASASSFWIATVLRKQIGYRGVIFSDDLEMGGILKFLPMEDAAVEAIRAGMDTVEICHSAELILRAYEALVREGEKSAAFRALLMRRAKEMEGKRERLFRAGAGPALAARRFEKLRAEILRFGEEVKAAFDSRGAAMHPRRRGTQAETT
ncbi:MAG TPA: glycoside hydrolase family 3 N-terminal domain-containing protein, partial [Terracidiphilus sp.]|nr:glycoside hydrolase family 3 N-terminal domain-containing protein [Terracidiphilus sp.]